MSIFSSALGTVTSSVTGWFSGEVAWVKWAGIALAVVAITGTIGAAYLHVHSLQKDLEKATTELAQEKVERQLADARANEIKAAHDEQIERINALESQRSAIAVEVTTLRQQIQEMDIENDIAGDNEDKAQKAIATLNARASALDERLRNVSGAKDPVRPGKAPGGKAVKAGAPSLVQRALQALRH